MVTQKQAMMDLETLSIYEKNAIFTQIHRTAMARRKKPHMDLTCVLGLLSLLIARFSPPVKNQMTDEEADQLISDIRHGNA